METIQVDILIQVIVTGHDVSISLEYTDSILSVVSATNVAYTFAHAVQSIVTNPGQVTADLNLLTRQDWGQLQRWNSHSPGKEVACAHDLVLQNSQDSPNAPAICARDVSLSYAELNQQSFQLAQHLVSLGVGPEMLVPICFWKSGIAIVAMIAILRAGGAFVPFDPAHPKDRIRAILAKTGNTVVVSPDTAVLFEDLEVTAVVVSPSSVQSMHAVNAVELKDRVRPDHPALVLFTSGSTGQPKGIIHEHASICTNSILHGPPLAITATSRVLQYAAYTFDVSMMDIFTTLIYGGCVCVPSDEDRTSNLVATMNEMRVSWTFFTPSVVSLLVPEDVPLLQTLVLGGEALSPENVRIWAERVRLLTCYGPSECAVQTIGELKPGDSPLNIGHAYGCGACWLTAPNDHSKLVPIGAIGELLVEAPTLARGYLHDIEKSKASFIKSPSWAHESRPGRPRRLYKTGDLLRQNSDGSFTFVGRKDFQLKVRGQRVEIGEVEHHLSTCPILAMSIVIRPLSGPYAKGLVGVLQLRGVKMDLATTGVGIRLLSAEELESAQFRSADVAEFLRCKVPGYMVPSHWLVVERLPLSASAKIDRRQVGSWILTVDRSEQLLGLDGDPSSRLIHTDDVTAREISSEVAHLIARGDERLRSVLEGQDLSLANAGLDSVQAMSLSMFARRRFGAKLPIKAIINPTATVRTVAVYIDNVRDDGDLKASAIAVDVMSEFLQYEKKTFATIIQREKSRRSVFLTGVTGFVGSQLLMQLLRDADVGRVVLHVRANSPEHGLQRVIKLAGTEGWWDENFRDRIEIWTGDLAAPKLGLPDKQWHRLCGDAPPEQCITDVIHNGATVHWNADFATLKGTNIDSTVEILRSVATSLYIARFVYVSGGQQLRLEEDDDHDIAREISQSNGYAQTKLVSELLVKSFARRSIANARRVSIVKPGYIIGTLDRGSANLTDYLWRLVASCVEIHAYNEADAGSWLFVSDVGRVATTILDSLNHDPHLVTSSSPRVVKILDGMTVGELWNVLQYECGYNIVPLPQDAWMSLLQKDIETKGSTHRLWPLIEILEAGKGCVGAPRNVQDIPKVDKAHLVATIKKNLGYLNDVGFLKSPGKGLDVLREAFSEPIYRKFPVDAISADEVGSRFDTDVQVIG